MARGTAAALVLLAGLSGTQGLVSLYRGHRVVMSSPDTSGFGSFIPKAKPFEVPNGIGVSTSAWGCMSRGFVCGSGGASSKQRRTFGKSLFAAGDLSTAYKILVNGGVSFFETGEAYGVEALTEQQQAEQLLGEFRAQNFKQPIDVAVHMVPSWLDPQKPSPLKPRFGRRGVVGAIQESLDRLGVGYVKMVQLGGPGHGYIGGRGKLAAGLAAAKQRGFCEHIGVVDHNAKELEAVVKLMKKHGVDVASNQVDLSLTNQDALFDGTVGACRRLGVKVLASAPLGGGLATGVYTVTNPTGGLMGKPRFTPRLLVPWNRLHMELEQIAKEASSRAELEVTPSQVSLNWVRAKGAIPLAGVKTEQHARDVVACLKWELTKSEVDRLDRVSQAARSGH